MTLWQIIQSLGDILLTIGSKLWELLTTPVATIMNNWDLPMWLDLIIATPLRWLFGDSGTLLTIIPAFIVIILIIRFVLLIFGRGS